MLETLDTSGTSLGSYSYGFTITAPSSVVPTISSVTASPVNDNSVISGWGIYVYGKSKAKLTINGAAGAYGSTIRSYSITTSPNVGSASAASYTTGLLYSSGTITVTAKVTDSRGRTATKTTTFSVYAYSAPYFSSVESYRCNSSGARDDVGGTYARIIRHFWPFHPQRQQQCLLPFGHDADRRQLFHLCYAHQRRSRHPRRRKPCRGRQLQCDDSR